MVVSIPPALSLVLFSAFLVLLLLRLFHKDLPRLLHQLRTLTPRDIPIPLLIAGFLLFFISINILPFNFTQYNELQTKYDYSFYFASAGGALNLHQSGFGTSLGGMYDVFRVIYYLLDINNILKTVLFNKVCLILIFVLSFFLVRRILGYFIHNKNHSLNEVFSSLLTMLYFSLAAVNSYYWTQLVYLMSAHLLFLIAFATLLDYLETKSPLSFALCLLASFLSFQTRPEFFLYSGFLFALHLVSQFDFSASRFRTISQKEQLNLIIHAVIFFIMCSIATLFTSSYTGLIQASTLTSTSLLSHLHEMSRILFGQFSTELLAILLFLIMAAIVSVKARRPLIVVTLISLPAVIIPIALSSKWDSLFCIYCSMILFFILLANPFNWLAARSSPLWPIALSIFIGLLILSSNSYILTSRTNLLTPYPFYLADRNTNLKSTEESLTTYEMLRSTSYPVFSEYRGILYLAYLLHDTNNTVLDITNLTIDSPRPSLISGRLDGCTLSQVEPFVRDYLKANPPLIPLNSSQTADLFKKTEAQPYAKMGNLRLCELLPLP